MQVPFLTPVICAHNNPMRNGDRDSFPGAAVLHPRSWSAGPCRASWAWGTVSPKHLQSLHKVPETQQLPGKM